MNTETTTATDKNFPNVAAAARWIAQNLDHSAVRMEVTPDSVIAHEQCAPEDATKTGWSPIMRMAVASRPARTYFVVRNNRRSVRVCLEAA